MATRRWYIVPCTRDRRAHLDRLRASVTANDPFARVVAVEQRPGEPVDRGMLRNIGAIFTGALNDEVLCFHDVDIVGRDRYPDPCSSSSVLHLYGHSHSLGGVVLMHAGAFRSLGGYPSRSGWGREDVALQRMAEGCGLHIDKRKLTHRFAPGGAFVELHDATARPLSAHAAKIQFKNSLARKQREAADAGPVLLRGDLDTDRPFELLDIKRRGGNFVWLLVSIPACE